MTVRILRGDCREMMRTMDEKSVHTCVTSPPYFGLRDYGHEGQIGLEANPQDFVAALVDVFREVRRVLRDDGTVWLNLGDTYANDAKWGGATGGKHAKGLHGDPIMRGKKNTGLKAKDLIGIPWRVAFALQEDGWYLRQDIIWSKPNPMPESVVDRCTKSHEYIFLLTKGPKYYFDAAAIREPVTDDRAPSRKVNLYGAGHSGPKRLESKPRGSFNGKTGDKAFRAVTDDRNKRSVWTISPKPFNEAHFAVYPPELIEPCILAGCPAGGTVLDPFGGAGTTGLVADRFQRNAVLCELNPDYAALAQRRIMRDGGMFTEVEMV